MTNPGKKPVELKPAARPSRIRRDPVRADEPKGLAAKVNFQSSEWEIGLAIVGMVLFALAMNIIWVAVGAWVGS